MTADHSPSLTSTDKSRRDRRLVKLAIKAAEETYPYGYLTPREVGIAENAALAVIASMDRSVRRG